MRAVTDTFLATLTGSHQMLVRATVLDTFQTGVAPTGTEIPVGSGSATFASTSAVRGSLDLTTDGTDMWPQLAAALLAPYGNEIFVERGVSYGDTQEWCSLGYFRIEEPSQDDPPDGDIRVIGKDRMQAIVDARLLAPVQFLASATYGDVVSQLVTEVYPTATIEWDDATDADTLGRAVMAEDRRFDFLDDLITAKGKIWYWDYRGVLVIKSVPDPRTPVWQVAAGEGGVLTSMSRKLSRAGVFNAIVATGESADDSVPIRGVALDNSPASPTYYYGRFGPVPDYYSSPLLLTTAQAEAAAMSILQKSLGLPYSVDFTAIPNPALEPYDPVRLIYSSRSAPEVHVLDTITVPLGAKDALRATTREQTTILIGTA